MNSILNIVNNRIIIGDGAMGTMLQACGLTGGQAPEEWVLKQPKKIENIHKSYINAGATMIETNTFGGNRIKLEGSGLDDSCREINLQAVKLARSAVGKDALVAGSVGPTGKLLQPYGDLEFDTAVEVFSEQMNFLVEAGVDTLLIETMSDLHEIRAALIAASKLKVPIIAQMTFTDNIKTLSGETPETSAIMLEALGADIIGINCTPGSRKTLPMLKKMNRVTDKPLSVYPNAGIPSLKGGKTVYPSTPAEFIAPVEQILNYGVRIMGGCCGTDPEYIEALSKKINKIAVNLSENKQGQDKKYLTSYRSYLAIDKTDNLRTAGEKYEFNLTDLSLIKEELSKYRSEFDILYLSTDKAYTHPLTALMQFINKLQLPLIIYAEEEGIIAEAISLYRGKPGLIITEANQFLLDKVHSQLPLSLVVNSSRILNTARKKGWKAEDIIFTEIRGLKDNSLGGLFLN